MKKISFKIFDKSNKSGHSSRHRHKISSERNFDAIITPKTPFEVKEAYKTLRTNIIFTTRGNGCKKYVVTSSVPGEGKTTNAINLAISFAETGKKVLLVDADLRKPRIHKWFAVSNKVGLSNYLSGIFEDEQGIGEKVVQKTDIENLEVVTSGHVPPNPIELLSCDGMRDFISNVAENYDFVIIDTPPINIVSDALVLSDYVTGYILVARNKYSEYDAVNASISKFELADIKPLGIILNDYDDNKATYNSKYKYKYKYRYDRYNYTYNFDENRG